MPTPPLSAEKIQEAIETFEKLGSITAAATALGIPRQTLQSRLAKAPISQDDSKPVTGSREDVIEDILRLVNEDTSRIVTRNHYRNEGRFAESAWISHFGTWDEAKRQAGVTLPRHAHRLGLHIAKHASVDSMRAMNEEKSSFEGKFLRPMSRRWQTTIVISDLHGLKCDGFFRRVFMDTVKRSQPEKIVINGDALDLAEFSKHTQDPRSFQVLEEIRWLHSFLGEMRELSEAEIHYTAGNHETRIMRHMAEQTPAMMVVLSELHGFTVSKLLGLDEFAVNYIDRGDLSAWTERDISAQLRKNYVTLFDRSLLFGHYPEMRSMGIPGANGHHHKHVVWPAYSPIYGAWEWHQTGCGHVREASYCAGEKWGIGFLMCLTDTSTKRTQFDYIDLTHDGAMVGGKFYQRDASEMVLDLAA